MDRCLAQHKELFSFIYVESSLTAQAVRLLRSTSLQFLFVRKLFNVHTTALCFIRTVFTHYSGLCVWLHRKRTNKSYVGISVLIFNPLHPFYSLSTCGLKSGSLFQFPHYLFVCASTLRVSKCVIFVLYI